MDRDPSAGVPRPSAHQLRNTLLAAAVVLAPSVVLIALGLGRAPA